MIIKSGFALLALLAATASSDAKLSQSLAGSTIAFPEVNRSAKADRLVARRATPPTPEARSDHFAS